MDKAETKTTPNFFKNLEAIFRPLLPGFITAGLCAGFASLLSQFIPNYESIPAWNVIYTLLKLINTAFTTYLSAWVGFSATKCFGCSQISGGMLGMATCLEEINKLSAVLGLYNQANPLNSVLRTGSGGIMTVIFGVWLLSHVEKFLQKKMTKTLNMVITPFISFFVCLIPCIFVFMPVFGIISNLLCKALEFLISNESLVVRIISGYICAALFLPANLFGLQFAFVAIYSVQLAEIGHITLYPALAMAGASQVGASLSVIIKTRKNGNKTLCASATSGILPGMMGIGTVLLYGVTVPHPKIFLMSCLGAGFGGAFIVATKVACAGWGPSGLLALPLMTEGAGSPLMSMLNYFLGLVISLIFGFLFTNFFVKKEDLLD